MFKNVLIATDGSELAKKAVQQGLTVAKGMKAKATVVRATPVPRMYVAEGVIITPPVEVHEQVAKVVADQFAGIKQEAGAAGVPCETVHVENDIPWQAILDTAKGKRCDLTRPDWLFRRIPWQRDSEGFLRSRPFPFSCAGNRRANSERIPIPRGRRCGQ